MKNESKFLKLQKRLERSIEQGRFFQFAKAKQIQLARRIQRYASSLKQAVKPAILSAFFALGLSATAQAQITFAEQTGVSNPLSGLNISGYAQPTFVDTDNDGDMDAFIGSGSTIIRYFNNNGTASNPSYTELQGAQNPLLGTFGIHQRMDFIDIDNDGDMDVFIGANGNGLMYYENTGTASIPNFVLQTGAASPVNGITVGYLTQPTLVDIDNDGDFDLFLSLVTGTVSYYENTGTDTSAIFTAQTGVNNPFNGVDVGFTASLSFGDLDQDGDFDAIMGERFGALFYYLNTGTSSGPVFIQQTGSSNPFDAIDVGNRSSPCFVDIDNDGDLDLFVGEGNTTGTVDYYKNTTVVGTKLLPTSNTINIFPNPTEGQVYFETVVEEGKLTIYNLMGQLVLEQNLQNTQMVDISELQNGTYLLKINNDKEVFSYKIVLMR